jgi:predicted Zn-dependent protease
VKTEIRFGREVSARILGAIPLSDSESLTRYVNLVGKSLVMHADRSEIEFHFAILDSDTVAAYSAPGGFVFITQGMFKAIHNEAELAAVLAHEIAHINLRHIVKELNIKAVNKEELSSLARFLGASGDTTRVVFNQAVDKAYQVLFKNGYKKSQELQADAQAVTLMALTGYDPNALASLLKRLASNHNKRNTSSTTHPQFARREQELNRVLQQISQSSSLTTAQQRFLQYSTSGDKP